MCSCGGVQSIHIAEQRVTSLANYVRQTSHVSYVTVLYVILPFDTQ